MGGSYWSDYEGSDEDGGGHGPVYDPPATGNLSLVDMELRGNRGWGVYQASSRAAEPPVLRTTRVQANLEGGISVRTGIADSKNLDISDNGGNGVRAEEGPSRADRAVISGNQDHGVHGLGRGTRSGIGSAVMMGGSTVSGNQGHGIYCEPGEVLLASCRIFNNHLPGLRIEGGLPPPHRTSG